MKRKIFSSICVFIIAIFTILVPLRIFADFNTDTDNQEKVSIISNLPDLFVPDGGPVQLNIPNYTTVIDVSTGIAYESQAEFFACIGNDALQQDSNLIYYIGYSSGYPMYIYSNRTPRDELEPYFNGEKLQAYVDAHPIQ